MKSCYAFSAFAVLVFATAVVSQPQVSFPISAQLPPVAVVEQPYEFVFATGTFTSTSTISYALQEAPSWLQLDNATRTLSGTPSAQEVGIASVIIKASNANGDVTDRTVLDVINSNSLSVDQAVLTQSLSAAGKLSKLNHLILYPETSFNLSFGPNAFMGANTSTRYFASSSDHSPLPAWVSFDDKAVAFTGITPALLTPQSSPELFSFMLAGSSIAGFTQTAVDFQISVANHIFAFINNTQSFSVSIGETVKIPPLLGQLQRDGHPIVPAIIQSTSANQPAWLMLESKDLSFSGTVPDSFSDSSFELAVTDDLNNIAKIQIELQGAGNNSISDTSHTVSDIDLGTVYATTSALFQYTYKSIFNIVRTDKVTLELDATPWLEFIRENLTVQGVVPNDASGRNFELDFVLNRNGYDLESAHLTVVAVGDSSTTSSNGPPSTSGPATSDSAAQSEPELTDHRKLVLLITMPILGTLLACVIVYAIFTKHRKRRHRDNQNGASSPSMNMAEMQRPYHDISSESSISENYAILTDTPNSSRAMLHDIESSPPPRIELPWSPHKGPTSRGLSSRNTRTPTTRSSWDEMLMEIDSPVRGGPSSRRHAATSNSEDTLPLPRPHVRPQTLRTGTKFNGRRRSGLGHGSSLGSPSSDRQLQTLRQVPVSPVHEDRSTDDLKRNASNSPFVSMDKMAMLDDTAVHQKHTKTVSPLSSNSRYAPAKSDHEVRSQGTSGSVWEDDDWRTESSDQKSSLWHAILPRNKSSAGRTLSSDEAAVAGLGSSYIGGLTNAGSHGRSLGQQSEQSQSNSLRFI